MQSGRPAAAAGRGIELPDPIPEVVDLDPLEPLSPVLLLPVADVLPEVLPGIIDCVRIELLALSQHLPVVLEVVVEVWAAAAPTPASMAAAAIKAILVIGLFSS